MKYECADHRQQRAARQVEGRHTCLASGELIPCNMRAILRWVNPSTPDWSSRTQPLPIDSLPIRRACEDYALLECWLANRFH